MEPAYGSAGQNNSRTIKIRQDDDREVETQKARFLEELARRGDG